MERKVTPNYSAKGGTGGGNKVGGSTFCQRTKGCNNKRIRHLYPCQVLHFSFANFIQFPIDRSLARAGPNISICLVNHPVNQGGIFFGRFLLPYVAMLVYQHLSSMKSYSDYSITHAGLNMMAHQNPWI